MTTGNARRKPILCLDFDGVIHSYTSGWKGAGTIPDEPVAGAVAAILSYLDGGFQVAIYSSRSKSLVGRWAMKRWLGRATADHWEQGHTPPCLMEAECWGDAYAIVDRIKWPWFKPSAFLTMDDRALTFEGYWPSAAKLMTFEPWYKLNPPEPIEPAP